jgi:quercetin dioxygenase-like cupin family protein
MKKLPRSSTTEGPEEWFTGRVYIDVIKPATDNSKFSMSSVHFTPGARAAWHSHPHGQTLCVTEGTGLIQRRGGPIEVIRSGDVIWTEPGEEHWHGAAAHTFMSHLALQEVDDTGSFADWKEHVSDEEYGAQPNL